MTDIRLTPENCFLQLDKDTGAITLKLAGLSIQNKQSKPKQKSRNQSTGKVPKALKDRLWDTTFGPDTGSGPCYVCGKKIYARTFEAGHVKAVSRGGPTILDNLRCICGTCNKSMGNTNLEDFKYDYFRSRKKEKPEQDITIHYFDHVEKKVSNDLPKLRSNISYQHGMKIEIFESVSQIDHKPVESEPIPDIQPSTCYLCGGDTTKDKKYDTPYFKCCHIRVHQYGTYECLTEYIKAGIELHGKTMFLRKTSCPKCLEGKYGIMKHFEKNKSEDSEESEDSEDSESDYE